MIPLIYNKLIYARTIKLNAIIISKKKRKVWEISEQISQESRRNNKKLAIIVGLIAAAVVISLVVGFVIISNPTTDAGSEDNSKDDSESDSGGWSGAIMPLRDLEINAFSALSSIELDLINIAQ